MRNFIIHHNDNDGRLAAFLMAQDISIKRGEDSVFIEADYRSEIDLSRFAGQRVYILDFSLPPDQMKALDIAAHLVWIDHHKTAIDANHTDYAGFRDTRYCGAMLTWMYLHGNQVTAPYVVILVDDYDCWKHQLVESRAFNAGSKVHDTRPHTPFWRAMLDNCNHVKQVADDGQTILMYQAQTHADRLAHIGWVSTFENRRCLCCDGILGSDAFGLDAFVKHPILVAYSHDGEQFSVSLYSDPTSGIDVGEIARQRGGGGHPNAAGFRCKTLPMIKEAAYVAR
jgi:oligoribonuclease NrnB/cAMP/cGMP phosphodiesterase (DHH superfamily)